MRVLMSFVATFLLTTLLPASAARAEVTEVVAAQEDDSVDFGRLSHQTCTALDAIGVAYSDNPKDPTGPASGAAVWGCYFGAFMSMSASPIAPGLATALSTSLSGAVGAYLDDKPFLPVLLYSLPGIGVGAALSAVGLGIAIGGTLAVLWLGPLATTTVIGLIGLGVLVYSLASIISGPLTLMGVIYAEEQSRHTPTLESAPVSMLSSDIHRF